MAYFWLQPDNVKQKLSIKYHNLAFVSPKHPEGVLKFTVHLFQHFRSNFLWLWLRYSTILYLFHRLLPGTNPQEQHTGQCMSALSKGNQTSGWFGLTWTPHEIYTPAPWPAGSTYHDRASSYASNFPSPFFWLLEPWQRKVLKFLCMQILGELWLCPLFY